MIRKLLTGLLAVTAVGLVGASARADEQKVVNVYNWSDYIAPDTVAKFEKETGIKVRYDVYDGNETLEAKLLAGNSGYDVVVPTAFPFLKRQVAAGVYLELDPEKIPNLKLLDPDLKKQTAVADPGNKHAAIYMWGTDGIGYNKKLVDARMPNAPVDSLALVFDPEIAKNFKDCGITMLDSPTDILPMALNYLGIEPTKATPAQLEKAKELLLKVRPYIKYFNSSQYINDLANGDICIAIGWSGDVLQAKSRAEEAKNGVEIEYTIPKEGTVVWADNLAIPKDAPHPDAAAAWINFNLRPDIEAANSNYISYANGVPDSKKLVDPAISGNPNIYPTPEIMKKLFVTVWDNPKFMKTVTRTWTTIRTGQ
ncbi:MAG: polyamine ABC transporter substrate-binding protein [Parvibaculaceae bacterium]|nr:polyamine ABC transporter substrate-binding protein [Parvibaculaceae bacterium]